MASHHIIFDCDGVLVDSEPLSMRIDVEILSENGYDISAEEAHARFVGKTFAAMLDEVKAETGLSFPPDASADKDRRLLALYERELRIVEGVMDALSAIGPQKYGVASNSPAERVATALRVTGLTAWFDGRITTFEHVARPKPQPDVYLEAARRAGFPPEKCIVIEDSVTGVLSAARAGCKVLGFTGTHPHRETQSLRLLEGGAAFVFYQMTALPGLVQGFLHDA